eukprot:COSAG06_NODE_1710_length_8634_cov_767.811365_2_plen_40_part_00
MLYIALQVAKAFWTRDDIFIDALRENYGERVRIHIYIYM